MVRSTYIYKIRGAKNLAYWNCIIVQQISNYKSKLNIESVSYCYFADWQNIFFWTFMYENKWKTNGL